MAKLIFHGDFHKPRWTRADRVTLTRKGSMFYEALVRPRGVSREPFMLTVCRGGPGEWVVDSDTERFFPTLKDARKYINTFFEPA